MNPGSQTPARERLARTGRAYATVAIHTFNVLLLFVGANLACVLFFALRPSPPAGNPTLFPRDKLHQAYGDMPMDVVLGTLDETWIRLRYEAKPWAHTGESEFSGRYVNVSKSGVRSNGPRGDRGGARPGAKPFRVIAFGGSTMWGYGVPDWETIPAHLERALQARHPGRAIEVVNQGHCFYWSAVELALFQSLIRREEHADAVVFLDGLNDTAAPFSDGDDPHFDEPAKMSVLRETFARQYAPPELLPGWLPIVKMIRRVRDHGVRTRALAAAAGRDTTAWAAHGDADAETILRMYLEDQRMASDAAAAAGIAPYFFWQPIPLYAYDTKKLLFDPGGEARHRFAIQALYAKVDERKPPHLTNLSRLLEGYDEPAYVDLHHYSPEVCGMIAERMADAIVVPD